jgi:hypothetical protein
MNHRNWLLFSAALAIGLGFVGPASRGRAQDRGEVVELGKLKSRVPTAWAAEKPDGPSGYKQYRLEPVGDDKEDARLTIEFLGKGNGGRAEEQVERWKAMFFPPEGRKPDDAARVRKLKVGDAAVTYLDIRGDYKGVPGNPATPRMNFRLLGVYFPTPQGLYLIRLFGPADTVGFYRKGFEDWVKGFKQVEPDR